MSSVLSAEAFYDAILDDDWFAHLPRMMARHYGARSCNMVWQLPDGAHQMVGQCGHFLPEHMALYAEGFTDKDLWAQRALTPDRVNRAHNCEEFVSADEYENSAFYNEWIRAIGDDTYYCAGMMVQTGWGTGLIGFHKGRTQGGFDQESLDGFAKDVMHIRKLLAVRGRLTVEQIARRTSAEMLDAVAQGVIALNPDGTLVSANAAAEAVLSEGSLLTVRRGRLEVVDPNDALRLSGAIGMAARPRNPSGSTLTLRGGGRDGLQITVLPLAVEGGPRRVTLLLGLGARSDTLARQLRTLFGLTAAEADLAVRLSEGVSPHDIAQARGVSVSTVRSQFKPLYSKMQCSGQLQVASLVQRIRSTGAGLWS